MSDGNHKKRPAETESLAIGAPETSANDEPVTVRITGASPGEPVELAATLEDGDGVEWSSQATFTADENGVVDATEHAPESGGYDGVARMGWLWSMTTDADAPFPRFEDLTRVNVDLRASTEADSTERTITRVLFDDGVISRDVDHDGLVGALYVPAGDGPHPGIVHLHGSGGRRSDSTAELLASRGFATLAIEYFGDPDPIPGELERVPLSYFDDAAAWLREQPEVADEKVGLLGASRGAELALILGARREWVGAVVSYAGSVPWDTPSGEPAWLDDGEVVPHITAEEAPRFEDLDEKPVADVVPAVENTNGPVLLLSGGDDHVWEARRLSEAVAERLDDHDFPYAYDHLTYDGVGHLVGTPYVPMGGLDEADQLSGTTSGTAHAAADSWPVVLEYLEDGLEKTE